MNMMSEMPNSQTSGPDHDPENSSESIVSFSITPKMTTTDFSTPLQTGYGIEVASRYTPPVHNNSTTVESYLEFLNEEFANFIMPAIAFISILMIVGLVGNIYVLYVYSNKDCNRTIIRFIQTLAVFDLLSCAIAMPGEILDMSQNYTFGSSSLCPTFRTVNLFCTMASGCTLVVVAVDRYRRICSPLQSQITPRTAGFIILGLSIVCIFMSLPSVAVFGSKTVTTPDVNINGTDCSISDSIASTPLPLVYNGFQLLLFLIGALALIFIYSLIARTICLKARQRKIRNRNRRRSLKNGLLTSPAYYKSDNVSSPSSPSIATGRPVFTYPDAVSDTVLDLDPDIASVQPSYTSKDADGKEIGNNTPGHQRHGTNASKKCKTTLTAIRPTSVTSSTSGISADITSNGTTSPPETPVDFQRLECVSLIKPRVTSSSWLPAVSHTNKISHDKTAGKQPQGKDKDTLESRAPTTIIVDQNGNKQDNGSKNPSQHNAEVETTMPVHLDTLNSEYEKPEIDTVTAFNCTPDSSQIVLRDLNLVNQVARQTNTQRVKGQSLFVPSNRRKVLLRSLSLGHEDTKGHRSLRHLRKNRKTTDCDSDIPVSPLRRRRLSSIRGLKELRKLTPTEYQGTLRTTFMLFLITLIYILSFLPHLVLMTFKALKDENSSWQVAHNIILRSYFINSVANPIIYSFCSRNFFSQCRNPKPGSSGTLTR